MAPRRAAGRLSAGLSHQHLSCSSSSSAIVAGSANHQLGKILALDPSSTDSRSASAERQAIIRSAASQASRPSRAGPSTRRTRSRSPDRSTTPSPILGPAFPSSGLPTSLELDSPKKEASNASALAELTSGIGHLSFPSLGLGLGPTKEQIELLVFGDEPDVDRIASDPSSCGDPANPLEEEKKAAEVDVDSLLSRLSEMGLTDGKNQATQSHSTREKELGEMIMALASHTKKLEESKTRAEANLRTNRLTALSIISSLKTTHAHALQAEASARERVEADLAGWKSQARMLSSMLSRAEARGYDERHITLIERPSIHTSRSLPPQISRAPSLSGKALDSASVLQEALDLSTPPRSSPNPDENDRTSIPRRDGQRASDSASQDAPAQQVADTVTGLGILNVAATEMDLEDSPMSSIIRERNKLAADKRYLRGRIRDAEAQIQRLENELKLMRPYLISGGIKLENANSNIEPSPSVTAPEASASAPSSGTVTAPTTPGRSGGRKEKSRRKRGVTMGDAETEHLMLAARRLREMRKEAAAASAASKTAIAAATAAAAVASTSSTVSKEGERSPNPRSPVKRQAADDPFASAHEGDVTITAVPRTPPSKHVERAPRTPRTGGSVPSTPRTGARGHPRTSANKSANPATGSSVEEVGRWSPQHGRVDSSLSGSSFTGIDELLQAAKSLTGPGSSPPGARSGPSQRSAYGQDPYYSKHLAHQYSADFNDPRSHFHPHVPDAAALPFESPKRRRVSSTALDFEPFGPPYSPDRRTPRGRTRTEGAEPFGVAPRDSGDFGESSQATSVLASSGLSALDLLADQAAASQNPSQGSERSYGPHEGVSPVGVGEPSTSEEEAMQMDEERAGAKAKTPSKPYETKLNGSRSNAKSPARGAGKGGSGTGSGGSKGAGSENHKSFGGNQNPEKRLPYVRWTSDEDTKLRAAIKEHGQRWELISRAVGTRSYHQCRQRYLLMRRKEAAAKAQAQAEASASLNSNSDHHDGEGEDGDDGEGNEDESERTYHDHIQVVPSVRSRANSHHSKALPNDDGRESFPRGLSEGSEPGRSGEDGMHPGRRVYEGPYGGAYTSYRSSASGNELSSPLMSSSPIVDGRGGVAAGGVTGGGMSPYTHQSPLPPHHRAAYYPPSPLTSRHPYPLPHPNAVQSHPHSLGGSPHQGPSHSHSRTHSQPQPHRYSERINPNSSVGPPGSVPGNVHSARDPPSSPLTHGSSRRMGAALYS
ncbi:hypothetical protein IE53DRAFT_362187 [Violaceomyces palustris]|uniref:Uncharacterized protein n=1 Tax=Violaceomyces palustris TaxID=1673888 RepID=A0ACD0NY16_9BASI|nr:hypothetical protein IE53DRAFT_362187 [Violaceomyces palustris]